MLSIIIIFLILLVIIIINGVFFVKYYKMVNSNHLMNVGDISFNLDLNNMVFSLNKVGISKRVTDLLNSINKSFMSEKNLPVENIVENFPNKEWQKKIRRLFYSFEKNTTSERVNSSIILTTKNGKYRVFVELQRHAKKNAVGIISWKKISAKTKLAYFPSSFTKFIKSKSYKKYNVFYAIELSDNYPDKFLADIYIELQKYLQKYNVLFWLENNIIFMIHSTQFKEITKIVRKKIKKLANSYHEVNFKKVFICGSSYIEVQNKTYTNRAICEIKSRLLFGIFFTKKISEPTLQSTIQIANANNLNSEFELKKFHNFLIKYNKIVETTNIRAKHFKVYNHNHNQVGIYLLPSIKHIMSANTTESIYSKSIHEQLSHMLVSNIIKNHLATQYKKAIVNIDSKFLINNYHSIKNKNYLYCVNLDHHIHKTNHDIKNIFSKLEKQGVKYGLLIDHKLNIDNETLKILGLSFVIVGEDITNDKYKTYLSTALLINQIFSKTKTRVIFLNLPQHLSDDEESILNIKYFINTK